MLKEFMSKLGYSELETEVFLSIYKYGPKPVSTIAKSTKIDRTYCYKVLNKMLSDKIISETQIKGVKNFFVPGSDVLMETLNRKQTELEKLNKQFDEVKTELHKYDVNKIAYAPSLQIFDGIDGIKNIYQDILKTIKSNNLLIIKFFASNTFNSQVMKNLEFEEIYLEFIKNLKNLNIMINGYVGSGVLIMESIDKMDEIKDLKKIIPGIGSTHGYLVGKCLYILQFKEIPLGFKIESFDMADMMHFMLENLKVNS